MAFSTSAGAQVRLQGTISEGAYDVHYSVFPSTFLQPDIAAAYGLKRSRYEALLNISVTPKGGTGGLPAEVSGTVTNLMQQQKTLTFKTIEEQKVAYFLAPVRVSGEEIVHFAITVHPKETDQSLSVTFSSKLVAQ